MNGGDRGLDTAVQQQIERAIRSIQAYRDNGGTGVALINALFPLAILDGCGVRPFRIMSGALTKHESIGEQLVRPDSCPFCKAMIGGLKDKATPHVLADLFIIVSTCDQVRRTAEVIEHDLVRPTLLIQYPMLDKDTSRQHFMREAKVLVKQLCAFAHTSFSLDSAVRSSMTRNRNAERMRALYLSAGVSAVLLHQLSALHAVADPEAFSAFLDTYIPLADTRIPTRRILIIGSPILEEDTALLSLLDQRGAYGLSTGSTGLSHFFSIGHPDTRTEDAFIEASLTRFLEHTTPVGVRPNTRLYEHIANLIETWKPDGIILKTLSFCDLWFTEKVRLRKTFDLPLLVLETGFGDGAHGQIETRVDTFLETL